MSRRAPFVKVGKAEDPVPDARLIEHTTWSSSDVNSGKVGRSFEEIFLQYQKLTLENSGMDIGEPGDGVAVTDKDGNVAAQGAWVQMGNMNFIGANTL